MLSQSVHKTLISEELGRSMKVEDPGTWLGPEAENRGITHIFWGEEAYDTVKHLYIWRQGGRNWWDFCKLKLIRRLGAIIHPRVLLV